MQFGKFHGLAFIVFGFLLLVVQLVLSFSPKTDVRTSTEAAPVVKRTSVLPGVVGGISLVGGLALFLSQRHKPQE